MDDITTFTSYTSVDSPLGALLLTGRAGALTGLYLEDHARAPVRHADWVRDDAAFDAPRRQLADYFAGVSRTFSLELDPAGTPFQRRVWDALLGIEHGTTVSYGDLAAAIGRPGAARAVGLANGANPISIVIPCHRVIGADGSLTGYGWGTERKRWLLEHEGALSQPRLRV